MIGTKLTARKRLRTSGRSRCNFSNQHLQLLQTTRLSNRGNGCELPQRGEITELAGCDRLTIAPALLKELQANHTALVRKLEYKGEVKAKPQPLTESEFYWQHNSDPMAVEKLAEGIRKFAIDQEKLEAMLLAKF